jgi:GR25 family glycosyltransferase involved in LPS biosynthesis
MTARLDALSIPHTFLKAVDGRTLSDAELRTMSPPERLAFPRPLLPNEVACGMSHLAAIAEGIRRDCDFFCVIEDDIALKPGLVDSLRDDVLNALPAFDVLRLFTHFDRWDKPSRIVAYRGDGIIVSMLRPGWGMQGQIYSRRGAKKIAAGLTTVPAPIDQAIYHDCLVSGLRVLEMRPGLVERDHAESAIGDRPEIVHDEGFAARTHRNAIRVRRKFGAAISFFRAWGFGAFFRHFSLWR